MKVFLAPMEGVVDYVVRDIFSEVSDIDFCVTEFMRVTDKLMPEHVFYRHCRELKNLTKNPLKGTRTASNTPVFFQLLGGNPIPMASNAQRAQHLGAWGIDINFGCPAKKVNNHDGGAVLLKEPRRVYDITQAVRAAVCPDVPVSAKIRLGYEDKSLVCEIAQAAEEAGACHLAVHARTKFEAYRPPAHWEYIRKIKDHISIPVIANGDIWTPEDYNQCYEISGCQDVMLGRGLIARPSLALEIKGQSSLWSWGQVLPLVVRFIFQCQEFSNEAFALQRTKQWTKLLGRTYTEGFHFFESIKRFKEYTELISFLKTYLPTQKLSPEASHQITLYSPLRSNKLSQYDSLGQVHTHPNSSTHTFA